MAFDPNARASDDSGIFGLPFSADESKLILLPVPWEVTTSYGGGTANGPDAILDASKQVDLFDLETGKLYENGFHMLKLNKKIIDLNKRGKVLAKRVRKLEESQKLSKEKAIELKKALKEVNLISEKLNSWVYETSLTWLKKNKLVGLVGGDHSTPHGFIKAIQEMHGADFGVLHIDAHHDLRKAYEGFTYSHASIMYNVMESAFAPKKLVQVGIRDFCEEEMQYAKAKNVSVFYDTEVQYRKIKGDSWATIAKEIVNSLPNKVYVSFDIDGLSPVFCPHTGTPVPGGLDYSEALYLLKLLSESGKKIIGFDLNEVAPSKDNEWDANVGARLLYKLCNWTLKSN